MPNLASYDLMAVSKNKESLERLLKIMKNEDPDYFIYRCFSASEIVQDPLDSYHALQISGTVAWSCNSWFETVEDVATEDASGSAHYITLDLLCSKLGIGIECWGEETGMGFQEYFLVNHKGEIVCNECREFQRNWFDSDGNDLSEPEEEGGFEEYLEFGDYGDIYGED